MLGAGQEAVRDGAGAYEFLLEKRPSHYARWPRATGSGGAEAVELRAWQGVMFVATLTPGQCHMGLCFCQQQLAQAQE